MKNLNIPWVIYSFSAGIGMSFTLLAYVHANFVTTNQMQSHNDQPHKGAITETTYSRDLNLIHQQLEAINRKLDLAIR